MGLGAQGSWGQLGEALVERYARSTWRLMVLTGLLLALPLASLYLLRGPRGLLLGAACYVAMLGFLVCFAQPFRTLLLSLFIAFSGLDVHLPGPIAWGLLAIVAARMVFDVLDGRNLDWGSTEFRSSLVILLALALTSLLVARSFDAWLARAFIIGLGLTMLLAVSTYAIEPGRIRAVIITVCAAYGINILGLLLLVVRSGGMGLLIRPTEESRMGIGDANTTAALACCLIPPLVHIISRLHWQQRLMVVPLLLINTAAVILAVSRVGIFLYLVTVGALLLQARRARLPVLLGCVIFLVLLSSLPSSYWTRFVSLGQFGGIVVDRSLQLRQHALEAGWQIFTENPLLGVGLGNFASESPRFMSLALWAHNTYVDVAATLGIFGLIAFLAWQYSGFAMATRAARLWRAASHTAERSLAWSIATALMILYIAGLTLDIGFHLVVWLFLGMANAVRISAEAGSN